MADGFRRCVHIMRARLRAAVRGQIYRLHSNYLTRAARLCLALIDASLPVSLLSFLSPPRASDSLFSSSPCLESLLIYVVVCTVPLFLILIDMRPGSG